MVDNKNKLNDEEIKNVNGGIGPHRGQCVPSSRYSVVKIDGKTVKVHEWFCCHPSFKGTLLECKNCNANKQ